MIFATLADIGYVGLPVIDEGLLKKYNARKNYVITIIVTL